MVAVFADRSPYANGGRGFARPTRPPHRPSSRRPLPAQPTEELPRYVRPAPPARPSTASFVRRRVVAMLAVAALIAILALSVAPRFRAALGGDPASATEGGPHTYVVHPGDTLWSIAERLAPGRDPRPVVDAITAVNSVALAGTADLTVGQVLRLPSRR